jgi:2-polyprenyl-6-methoxyphenol hydroxylase-like FAD-dependent oxidoreductase
LTAGQANCPASSRVGDVEVDGLGRDAWHQWFAGEGAIMLCPLPGTDAFQVQASHELGPDGTPLEPTLETFQQTFDRIAGIPSVRLHNLTWRSSYRVNVRMVDRLRVDRVFLAGDAAHAAHAYGQDALILIRPDGHIGLIADADDALAVADYLRSV